MPVPVRGVDDPIRTRERAAPDIMVDALQRIALALATDDENDMELAMRLVARKALERAEALLPGITQRGGT